MFEIQKNIHKRTKIGTPFFFDVFNTCLQKCKVISKSLNITFPAKIDEFLTKSTEKLFWKLLFSDC